MDDGDHRQDFRRLAWEAIKRFSWGNALTWVFFVMPSFAGYLGATLLSPQWMKVLSFAGGVVVSILFLVGVFVWNYTKAAVYRARELEDKLKPRLKLGFRDEIGTAFHQSETGVTLGALPKTGAAFHGFQSIGGARKWELDLFRMSVQNTGLDTLYDVRVELVEIQPKYQKLKLPLRLRFKGGIDDEFETKALVAEQPVYVDVVKQTRGLDEDDAIEILHTEPKSDRVIPLSDYKLKITAWGTEMRPETIWFQITSQRGRLTMWKIP